MTAYDPDNIFAKILRGDIPSKKILETVHTLAFHDAFPKAKTHALVISKGAYLNILDFSQRASSEEMQDFWKTVKDVAHLLNLHDAGFRLISNSGTHGGQEVPHFHVHLLGGQALGPLVALPR